MHLPPKKNHFKDKIYEFVDYNGFIPFTPTTILYTFPDALGNGMPYYATFDIYGKGGEGVTGGGGGGGGGYIRVKMLAFPNLIVSINFDSYVSFKINNSVGPYTPTSFNFMFRISGGFKATGAIGGGGSNSLGYGFQIYTNYTTLFANYFTIEKLVHGENGENLENDGKGGNCECHYGNTGDYNGGGGGFDSDKNPYPNQSAKYGIWRAYVTFKEVIHE